MHYGCSAGSHRRARTATAQIEMPLAVRSTLALLLLPIRTAAVAPAAADLELRPPGGPRFPPPHWQVVWNLTESTMIQPSSASWFSTNHTWGLVSLDWTVARDIWDRDGRNRQICEATSREGCRRLKAAGKTRRCFVYHNMELALEWLESQRLVMRDPAKGTWFLQYTDGSGRKNGTIYNEIGEFPPGVTIGDQYFWDYRVDAASEYYVSSVLESVSDPAVDGTFTDDVTGLPNEHHAVQRRIKMNDSELHQLQGATNATHARLVERLLAAGKSNWQAFFGNDVAFGDDADGVHISRATCTEFMRYYCTPQMQRQSLMMGT